MDSTNFLLLSVCDPVVCVPLGPKHTHTKCIHKQNVHLYICTSPASRKHQFSVRWRNKCQSKAVSLPAFSIHNYHSAPTKTEPKNLTKKKKEKEESKWKIYEIYNNGMCVVYSFVFVYYFFMPRSN